MDDPFPSVKGMTFTEFTLVSQRTKQIEDQTGPPKSYGPVLTEHDQTSP